MIGRRLMPAYSAIKCQSHEGGQSTVDPGHPMPVGECTSDTGAHVRRDRLAMCAPPLPHMAGFLTGYGAAAPTVVPLRRNQALTVLPAVRGRGLKSCATFTSP